MMPLLFTMLLDNISNSKQVGQTQMSINRLIEKQTLYTYTIKYYLALEMKDILLHAITWIKLEGILVSEIGQSQNENTV